MPRKGMRSFLFASSNSKASSSSISHYPSPQPSPQPSLPMTPLHNISGSMIEQNLEIAHSIITKWDRDTSSYAKVTSLFLENRKEAKDFLKSVKDLQRAMHFYVSDHSNSDKLVRAQNLMQIAMKRLEKEFYQILSANRDHLDPESVSGRSSRVSARSSTSDYEDDVELEEEIQIARDSISKVEQASTIAMADLKSIADCMISSGYGKECVKIYKIIRKSIVDEGLYRLGVERLTSSQIHKMDWEVLELKINNWLNAVKIAVKTLFSGERILCDHVFSASESIRESCFSEISKEGAIHLFGFAEYVAKSKKSPVKMSRMLDIYDTISNLWPEIDLIFSFESTSVVRSQALTSLKKLGDAVRTMLSDFQSSIQKHSSKSLVSGGGIHPLTQYVMDYISLLADYSGIISDIVADCSMPVQSPLPESYFDNPNFDDSPTSTVSVRFAWLILVLLCKLDGKAELYKDVSLSYLFLANNLQYVAEKVRTSNLRYLIGEDWILKHEAKVKQYASSYERMAWSKVFSSLPENTTAMISPEAVKDYLNRFNSAFDQVYRKQTSWVVMDGKLRDEIRVSISKKLEPAYRAFYDKYRDTLRSDKNVEVYVRFTPEDLGNNLSDLFYGSGVSESLSSSHSLSSHSRESRSV